MKNKWKTAFWILFTVFILMTGFLIYTISDMGVTIANLYERYDRVDVDLKSLSGIVEGKLSREDFKDFAGTEDTTRIKMEILTVSFGADNTVREVKALW